MTNENKTNGRESSRKVMIVDDVFVDAARTMHGIKPFDYADFQEEIEASFREHRCYGADNLDEFIAENREELRGDALENYLHKTKNPAFFDLTKPYQEAGGKQNIELLILGNPVCGLSPNDFYPHNPLQRKLIAKKAFSERDALKTIEDIKPDVLILDMGFYAPVSNFLIAEYILKQKEKEQTRFKVKPDCRSCEIDFPLYGDYLEDLLGYTSRSLQSKGGVILANALRSVGRGFSFWTGDLHHGGEGIAHAHTLDLVSEEEIRQVVTSDNASFAVQSRLSDKRREAEKDQKSRENAWNIVRSKTPIAQSDNGRIVVAEKGIFYEKGGFNPLLVPKLDRIIKIASEYQQKTI